MTSTRNWTMSSPSEVLRLTISARSSFRRELPGAREGARPLAEGEMACLTACGTWSPSFSSWRVASRRCQYVAPSILPSIISIKKSTMSSPSLVFSRTISAMGLGPVLAWVSHICSNLMRVGGRCQRGMAGGLRVTRWRFPAVVGCSAPPPGPPWVPVVPGMTREGGVSPGGVRGGCSGVALPLPWIPASAGTTKRRRTPAPCHHTVAPHSDAGPMGNGRGALRRRTGSTWVCAPQLPPHHGYRFSPVRRRRESEGTHSTTDGRIDAVPNYPVTAEGSQVTRPDWV